MAQHIPGTGPQFPYHPGGAPSDHGFAIVNRVETRTRTADFEDALRAPVHDPLWMLTRQWQFGELRGEDTGRAVSAQVTVDIHPVTHRQTADGHVHPIDAQRPREAEATAMPIPWDMGRRLRVGQQWRRALKDALPTATARAVWDASRTRFAFTTPGTHSAQGTPQNTHADPLISAAAALGAARGLDGEALVQALRAAPASSLALTPLSVADASALDGAGAALLTWTDAALLDAPDTSWDPQSMTHRAAFIAPRAGQSPAVMQNAQMQETTLGWASTDGGGPTTPLPALPALSSTEHRVVLATPLQFAGMPAPRWWAFEDGRVDFGTLSMQDGVDEANLAQILCAEFALAYGNDWQLLPLTLPAGAACTVSNVVVRDVFGLRTKVERAGSDAMHTGWDRFAAFTHTAENGDAPYAWVTPGATEVQRGKPLEDVLFLRDEGANLVWAIEQTLDDGFGAGMDGGLAATRARQVALAAAGLSDETPPPRSVSGADYQYTLRSGSPPENWIPFVPQAVDAPGLPTLRRGRLPRLHHGRTVGDVRARTAVLGATRPGPMSIHGQTVSRAGTRVQRLYQRARGPDGSTTVWLTQRATTGTGESRAGLSYDTLTPQLPDTRTS